MQTLSTAWTETGDININICYYNGKRKEEEVDPGEGNVKKNIFHCHVKWCLKLKNKNRQANHIASKLGDKLVKRTWRLKNGGLESGYLWGRELGKGWLGQVFLTINHDCLHCEYLNTLNVYKIHMIYARHSIYFHKGENLNFYK